jgi:toxin HigB-1
VIVSFKHKGLKNYFEKGDASKLPAIHLERISDILALLNTASSVKDLMVPTFKTHQLKGSRKGTWSMNVQANWRITFNIENDKVEVISIEDVNYEDYH